MTNLVTRARRQTGILISSKQGAQGQIALCTDPVLAATSGKYWADLASEGKAGTHQQRRSSAASYNLEDSAKLWQVSQVRAWPAPAG